MLSSSSSSSSICRHKHPPLLPFFLFPLSSSLTLTCPFVRSFPAWVRDRKRGRSQWRKMGCSFHSSQSTYAPKERKKERKKGKEGFRADAPKREEGKSPLTYTVWGRRVPRYSVPFFYFLCCIRYNLAVSTSLLVFIGPLFTFHPLFLTWLRKISFDHGCARCAMRSGRRMLTWITYKHVHLSCTSIFWCLLTFTVQWSTVMWSQDKVIFFFTLA